MPVLADVSRWFPFHPDIYEIRLTLITPVRRLELSCSAPAALDLDSDGLLNRHELKVTA